MASTTGEEPTGSTMVESSPSVAMEAKLMLSSGQGDCQKLKDLLKKASATPMVAVMAFSSGKEPPSSAEAAKAPTVDMDARLMVSTGHGDCQKLKNLLNKKDATITVVVTASCYQDSKAKLALTSSQLRLLAAASEGPNRNPGVACLIDDGANRSLQGATTDVEEGINAEAPSAASLLLNCFTVEGDTPLHLVAANGAIGDDEKCKRCAELIHEKDEDKSLLYKKNNKGETPLHCAARARKSQLVSRLIRLAKDDGKAQDLLRMVNNNNETALHEAVRRFHIQMIKRLLREDPELASFPVEGTSPLYLAIQLEDITAIILKEDKQATAGDCNGLLRTNEEKSLVQTIYDESKDGFLSYLGPSGKNALHAAVLRGPVLTRKLLRWNKDLTKRWNQDLTIQRDENGSTPLHFAAGFRGAHRRGSVCSQLLEANTDALYQLDNDGLSPMHVAASVGASQAIGLFLRKCPGSAGLRDAKGRTFLHVAVENKQWWVINHACMHPCPLVARICFRQACLSPSHQAWIMNMQDNDGNTALHLAVQAGSLRMFSALFGNRYVHVSIANAEGQTPLDIAHYMVPPSGLFYNQNSEVRIRRALEMIGARRGVSRWDHFQENHKDIHGLKSEYESKELEKMKDMTQTRSIASVLIATVAFGATFALPGGYKADDHVHGGTPTLAGRFAFDAFMMANALAFIFSAAAIICLVRGGTPTFNLSSRKIYSGMVFFFMETSVTCLIAAFALGVFVVLSPVALKTAIAIGVMSCLPLVISTSGEFWPRWFLLLPSFLVRKGLPWTLFKYTQLFVGNTIVEFWPFLLIFIWAAYGRTHPSSKVEPP
ncbi:hypothetical protein EJB05_32268, partial [Eragrostis curvula]